MGHRMTHIEGFPAVVGGYSDIDNLRSVEFFEDGLWRTEPDVLEFDV